MSATESEDLAAVAAAVQDLANTARAQLDDGATPDDIIGPIAQAVLDAPEAAEQTAMTLAIAVYLLAKQAQVAWDDRGRTRTGERSIGPATTAQACTWVTHMRTGGYAVDALFRRRPLDRWREQEVPRG